MHFGGGMSDKTQIKIFILFLLDELRYPLDDSTISRIVQENGYVGMFDFQECFSELQEQGHVSEYEDGGVKYYTISETGHIVASELQDEIMESIREKSAKSASRLLSLHKRNARVECTVKEADGRFCVTATVTERGRETYRVEIAVNSAAEADRMKKHFLDKPDEVCRGLMAVMSGEVDYLLS